MTTIRQDAANAMLTFRQRRGLTHDQLAALIPVHSTTLLHWEHAKGLPCPENAQRLLDLGVPIPIPLLCPLTPQDVRSWRTQQHLSQAKLATILHVHYSTVAHWESGRKNVNPQHTQDLFNLGCLPADYPLLRQYHHPNAPAPRPPDCSQCPALEDCTILAKHGLWCLCEHLPPTAADLIKAFRLDLPQYHITTNAIQHTLQTGSPPNVQRAALAQ